MNRYMRGMSNGGLVMASGPEPLELDQIRNSVPSVFAAEPHESRSERYAYIPTSAVLAGLQSEGFQPFYAQQSRSRVPGKSDFTKHMLRLRHQSRTDEKGEAHEIILVNAHDGTSSYQMISGVFRFVCANGLFAGDTFSDFKVRHTGDAVDQVIEGAYTVLEDADEIMDSVAEMKGNYLSLPHQEAFAKAALALRYEDADRAPIPADRLLSARRGADQGNDLWSTFNCVQENIIRGGLRGSVRDANNRRRGATMRGVTGIDQTKALNRALWTLAEALGEHTHAA